MGTILCIVAFITCLMLAARSLGWGIAVALAVGYLNGIMRGNISDAGTTFIFDSSLLCVYTGHFFLAHKDALTLDQSRTAKQWMTILMIFPIMLSLLPLQHPLIQLVGLRAAIYFLPFLLLGTRIRDEDLVIISRVLAVMNMVAFAVAAGEYFLGVERFFVESSITTHIYNSRDVGEGFNRIPATFLSAAGYGGTMLLSIPFVVGRALARSVARFERLLMIAASLAALTGIFGCGSRSPVAMLVLALAIFWALNRFSLKYFGLILLGTLLVGTIVVTNERFQRFLMLAETDKTLTRAEMSVNMQFFDALTNYPLGAGLGRAMGTSIPYFLQDLAPEQFGAENEFSWLVIEQGWIGLGLWLSMLIWLFTTRRFNQSDPNLVTMQLAFGVTLVQWGTAFIGVGTLTAIPSTAMLLLSMGLLMRQPVYSTELVPSLEPVSDMVPAGAW